MTRRDMREGFTLVELAIVLVIVGLLIGGILKGQELMQNARVTATVAQLKSMEAAVTNFYDMYKEKPGDLISPNTRIKDCPATKCDFGAFGELGNGRIGTATWDLQVNQTVPFNAAPTDDATAVANETVLFWYELLKTGLISGVTDEGINSTTAATLGGTIPEMKVGGGLWVGNSSQSIATFDQLGKTVAPTVRGTVLTTVNKPDVPPSVQVGTQSLYPRDSANIDRKLDDGLPNTGNVQAYGGSEIGAAPAGLTKGNCYSNVTNIYSESVNSKDCGLYIRIFK